MSENTEYSVKTDTDLAELRSRYDKALESFVDKLRPDPNVIAVIVCGSTAYDTVWEKSDIDIHVLVREIKITTRSFCIDEDGILLNVDLAKVFDFKRMMEKSRGGEMVSSLYLQARIVYTTDESLYEFMDGFKTIGTDDRNRVFFRYACYLIGNMEKIEKWLTVKNNTLYAQFWILKTVDIYAEMLLILDYIIPNREAVLKTMELMPDKIHSLYEKPMSGFMTREEVAEVLEILKDFLKDNLDILKQPVIEYMSDGEVRTVTTLVKHFGTDSHSICHVFDFLAEMDVVIKVSQTARITSKSRMAVEEIAFMYMSDSNFQF